MDRASAALVAIVALVTASPAIAQRTETEPLTETYGDWTVIAATEEVFMATTQNNAGAVFGTLCTAQECTALLNPELQCRVGESYPALVNSPGGAVAVYLLCEDFGEGTLVYSFAIDEGVAEAMAVGGVIGIAFPMESGEFRVERFSLTGAARATGRASQLAQGLAETGRQNASDSSTL